MSEKGKAVSKEQYGSTLIIRKSSLDNTQKKELQVHSSKQTLLCPLHSIGIRPSSSFILITPSKFTTLSRNTSSQLATSKKLPFYTPPPNIIC